MAAVLLRVDPGLALPVYEQIRTQIVRLATSGQLPAGARLPTIRQLAVDLGLAKGTIERAYLQLEADGMIETRGRNGTFLTARTQTKPGQVAQDDLMAAAEAFAITATQLGVDHHAAIAAVRHALERLQ